MLTSKQRAYLRSLANTLEPVLHVGKDGVGENLTAQADGVLEKRELIKGHVLENSPLSPREAAAQIAAATNSEVVQVIGSKFVLFRIQQDKSKRKIELPKAAKKKA
jgi:RNA-binding protein